MQEFISEDDLKTFEGWLRYQAVDAATATPDELAMWRGLFDELSKRSLATPKVGLMKLRSVPGEHRYAVAVREGSDLWVTLWVRRSRKGRIFRHGAAPRSGLGRSHKLSSRRHAAHEELRPNAQFAKTPAFDGKIPGNGAPREFHGARSEKRRGSLRPDRLFWSRRSCVWCVGATRWRSCGGPRRAGLRAAILAVRPCRSAGSLS